MNDRRRRVTLQLLTLPLLAAGGGGSLVAARGDGAAAGRRVELPPFSSAPIGDRLPPGWTHQTLPSVERANRFALVSDDGTTVLRVLSEASASSLAVAQRVDPLQTPLLRWRWWVSNALAGSDLRYRTTDDYAARVYVLFDLPEERLSVGDRMKAAAVRLLHGADLPTAALCYVWGNAQAVGESAWNAYTDRLRMIVVDSGDAHAREWREGLRDVASDFRAAFGYPVPTISGVAVAADTDNTGGSVETRFADLHFEAAR